MSIPTATTETVPALTPEQAILPLEGLIPVEALRTSLGEAIAGRAKATRAKAYINYMLLMDNWGIKDLSVSYSYKGDLPEDEGTDERTKLGFIVGQILKNPKFFKDHFEKAGIGASIYKEKDTYILDIHWGAGPLEFPQYYNEEYRNTALWRTELAPSTLEVMQATN